MKRSGELAFGSAETTAVSQDIESGKLWRGNGAGWGSQQDAPQYGAADRLEDELARRLSVRYVHAVNSGTSANEAALASFGLSPGDEVICPAVVPVFVPFAILAVGCIPVFADIDPHTLLIDPQAIESVVSDRSRALVVVHIWGMPAPMGSLMSVARRFKLKVLEDCAQALSTTISGRSVGSFGDASCFSFQQSKHVSSGEGGACATGSELAYTEAVLYSNAGIPSYRYGVAAPVNELPAVTRGHLRFGHNHRISELQASVALAQLLRVEDFARRRAELVDVIESRLPRYGASVRGVPSFADCQVSYWRYPVVVPPGRGTFVGVAYREPIFQAMNRERRTPFGMPLASHVVYEPGTCPQAERGTAQIRSIALHHGMSDDEVCALVSKTLQDL